MNAQMIWAQWALLDGVNFRLSRAWLSMRRRLWQLAAAPTWSDSIRTPLWSGGADYLMLPGFINSHDHGRALGTVSLGTPDSFLEVWLTYLGTIPRLPPRLAVTYEGLQLIKSGVTATAHSHNPASFEAMFAEVPETLQGYRDAGVRVAMHPPFMDQNRLIYDDRDSFLASLPPNLIEAAQSALKVSDSFTVNDYFRELDALYQSSHDPDTHWAHIQISPVGGQWASDEFTRRCAEWAQHRQTRMQMHMLETRYQQAYAFRRWNQGFIEHLDTLGVLGDWLTLAHMVWVEDTDAALLAKRGVGVAHNPSSNLRLRSGIAPVAAFQQAGVQVGIGLDGHGLDDDQDFLREMRLAFTLANQPGGRSPDVTPLQIFAMATRIGAAITFGPAAPLGELAAGKLADVVLLDWAAVKGAWCPANFPAPGHMPQFCLRRATRQHVRAVMVHGEWKVKNGQHTELDEAAINRAVREAFAEQMPPEPSALDGYVRRHYASWDER